MPAAPRPAAGQGLKGVWPPGAPAQPAAGPRVCCARQQVPGGGGQLPHSEAVPQDHSTNFLELSLSLSLTLRRHHTGRHGCLHATLVLKGQACKKPQASTKAEHSLASLDCLTPSNFRSSGSGRTCSKLALVSGCLQGPRQQGAPKPSCKLAAEGITAEFKLTDCSPKQ